MSTATLAPNPPAADLAATTTVRDLLEEVISRTEALQRRGQITVDPSGALRFGDFEGIQRYARTLAAAGMVPWQDGDTPESQLARATICISLGQRVGLSPEEAAASIYVVNNRPKIFGDAPLAICRQHPLWVEAAFDEWFEVAGVRIQGYPPPTAFRDETTAAYCQTQRRGARGPRVRSFSVADAKAAKLFGRKGEMYEKFAQRMLQARARGFALADNFGDALKGIGCEESADAGIVPVEEAPPINGNGNGNGKAAAEHHAPAEPAEQPAPEPPSVQASEGVRSPEGPATADDGEVPPSEETEGGTADDLDGIVSQWQELIDSARSNSRFRNLNGDLESRREALGPAYGAIAAYLRTAWKAWAASQPQGGR